MGKQATSLYRERFEAFAEAAKVVARDAAKGRGGHPAKKMGRPRGEATKPLGVRLPSRLIDEAQRWAELSGTTLRELLGTLLEAYLAPRRAKMAEIKSVMERPDGPPAA